MSNVRNKYQKMQGTTALHLLLLTENRMFYTGLYHTRENVLIKNQERKRNRQETDQMLSPVS